jgi:hypothetical protein
MPPYFLVAAVAAGLVVVGTVAGFVVGLVAGVVTAGFVVAGVVAAVVAGAVVEGEEQPVMIKAQTNSTTRGMKTFLTIRLLLNIFHFQEQSFGGFDRHTYE